MILLGLGANLPSPTHGCPAETLTAALAALSECGIAVLKCSRWYETAPVPKSAQPWYVNGVAALATELTPGALLTRLHRLEADFGRVRGERNGSRLIDLDLLAYDDLIRSDWPVLPHPRLAERAFVLRPLAEIAPDWRHPASGIDVPTLLARLGPEQETRLLEQGCFGAGGAKS
jgi:2-amino-4-hydroxy-6-hydroxymethyldihydropteridine diphosphokinase